MSVQTRKYVYIGVIGLGGVGKAVLTQLLHIRIRYPQLRLVLLSASKQFLDAFPTHSETDSIVDLFPALSLLPNESHWSSCNGVTSDALNLAKMISKLARTGAGPKVLIDCTASTKVVRETYAPALQAGIHVVTPNKVAFALEEKEWETIKSFAYRPGNEQGGLLYHESTVGAGLPIISTIKDLIDTGDRIKRIEGVFSGTLSYLFNTYTPLGGGGDAQKWSDIVKTAQKLGYTEPDPRLDLAGLDVVRKLIILARLCGLKVRNVEAVPAESLIPEALTTADSAAAFLEGLGKYDGDMAGRKEQAVKAGKVLRYVGSIDIEKGEVKASVQTVGGESALAGLKGADNVVAITSERYAERPLVIQGAGAGADVTAMGVVSDVIRVVERVS